ncbi:hypothetical protein ACTFIV_005863 [Dictyostelium citrinum]
MTQHTNFNHMGHHNQHHHHQNHHQNHYHYQPNQMNTTQGKISLHDIFETSHGDVFIVSSLSNKKDTQIIRIEGRCGMLLFEGLPGVDIFPNHRQAVAYLKKKHTLKSNIRVFAILGYIISERSSHLLVATKIRNEGELLGSYPIITIIETSWIKIDLSYLSSYQSNEIQTEEGWATTLVDDSNIDSLVSSNSKNNNYSDNNENNSNSNSGSSTSFFSFLSSSSSPSNNTHNNNNGSGSNSNYDSIGNNNYESNNNSSRNNNSSNNDPTVKQMLKDLQTFPLDGTHFYCELYDLTNYFPSNFNTPFQYCPEFTWNEWMRKPFENASLSHLCVVLLQGYASVKSIPNLNVSIAYLMKRSKLNPGTHFYSPGINENASPANEYESEIIMWKVQDKQSILINNIGSGNINLSELDKKLNSTNNTNGSGGNGLISTASTTSMAISSSSLSTTASLSSSSTTSNSTTIPKVDINKINETDDSNGNNTNNNNFNEKVIQWTSHVWRRGTVPLWWRAFSKNQGSNEIELFLKDRGRENPNPFEKSEIYYQNLLSRYEKFYQENKDTNLAGIPTIQLVNLLKQQNDRQELILSQLYKKSCENVTTYLNVDLQMYTFDWINILKANNNSLSKTVQNLWDSTKSSLDSVGFSTGLIKPFDNNQLVGSNVNTINNIGGNGQQIINNGIGNITSPSPSLSSSSFLPMTSSPFIKNTPLPNPSPILNPLSTSGGYSSNDFANLPSASLQQQQQQLPYGSFSPSPQLISNSSSSVSSTTSNHNNSSTPSSLEKKFIFLNYHPQKEIIRYSCLDSLERVNIVLFFNFFQIVSKMGSELGIPSLNELLSFGSSTLDFMLSTFKSLNLFGPLIEFYVCSSDISSILYHNNPPTPNPIMRELVQQLQQQQTSTSNTKTNSLNSTICQSSTLTNNTNGIILNKSLASSTNKISSTNSTNSTTSTIPNPTITTTHLLNSQRKYQLTHSDENRSYQYLLMLGNCFGFSSRFFPFNSSIGKDLSPYWISSAPSSCVMSLPTLLCNNGSNLNPSILIRDIDDFCWISPMDTNQVEMVIYLGQPCVVTEICITVAHGINSDSYPKTMDVLVGNYYDQVNFVLQDVELPRCTTGTKLSYILPNSPWEAYSSRFNQTNNLGGGVSSDRYFNRIVKLIFTGTHTPITIGKVEVFGYHSNSYFNNNNQLTLNINPTYRNSFDFNKNYHSNSSYTQSITNDIYHQMERKKQQQQKSNNSISNTFINYQIDNILNVLNQSSSSPISPSSPNGSKNNSFNDYNSLLKHQQQQQQKQQLPIEMLKTDSPNITSEQQNEILLFNDYNNNNENQVKQKQLQQNQQQPNQKQQTETIQLNNQIDNNTKIKQYESSIIELNLKGIVTFLESLELENKRVQFGISPQERDKILKKLNINSNLLNPDRFIFERDEKIEVNIRKSNKYKSPICQRPQCSKPLVFFDKIRHQQCCYCYKRFCPACVSSNQVKIFEFESTKLISVCYTCAILIGKQEQLFRKVQISDRQYYLLKSKFKPSFYQKILLDLHFNQNNVNINLNSLSTLPTTYESIVEMLTPLAEYPKGGIINSVPTATESPPIESILLAPSILPLNMYWKAPADTNSVDIDVMLSYESMVYSISLIVDSIGYHNYDLPIISISYGKTFTTRDQYQEIGQWVLHPNGWSSNDPNLVIQPSSCVSYILNKPIQARIISLRLTLPAIPTFLSALQYGIIPSKPQLHIGRISIHGIFSDSLSDISTWSSSSLPLSPSDKDLYDNTLYSTSFITAPKRNPMKTNIQIKSNKSIHISLAYQVPNNIRGFSLIITHDENEGVKSQVKGISISFYSVNQKNELSSHQYLSQILVPKCRLSSTLYFDFPIPLPPNYILAFEFISNYGGKTNSFPKVNLY